MTEVAASVNYKRYIDQVIEFTEFGQRIFGPKVPQFKRGRIVEIESYECDFDNPQNDTLKIVIDFGEFEETIVMRPMVRWEDYFTIVDQEETDDQESIDELNNYMNILNKNQDNVNPVAVKVIKELIEQRRVDRKERIIYR